MAYIPQVLFVLLLAVAAFLIFKRVRQIAKNIKLGKPLSRNDQKSKRFKYMLLLAFGQKKMFDRPIIGILHFFIYAGFILINIEVLEIIIDGITGSHRIFAHILPTSFYNLLISFFEFLAFAVLVACIIFLVRRLSGNVSRFKKPEMKGWPTLDANLILIIESVLMFAILLMNASDTILQVRGEAHYPMVGYFWFSQFLIPVLNNFGTSFLIILERGAWWFHILGIFAFALYVTYSKHLHIALAFPNSYFANLNPKGTITNMDSVTTEVKFDLGIIQDESLLEEEIDLGAKDVNQLTWKQLMSAYACTECGRCTDNCPANQSGQKLSPRKIMMDTRDRVEEVGSMISKGKSKEEALETGESLYSDKYISKEEIMACTTCNACVDACPVSIDPLSIIIELRRYVAMEEASTPAQWNAMFTNIENNMSPWKFSPADRFNWADEI